MSLKSIDMSLAVHKNADAGQLQRELQQKPAADQAALAESGVKTADNERQRPSMLEETDKSRIRARQEGQKGKKDKGSSSKSAGTKADDPKRSHTADPGHPFKGHHIDLSL